MNILMVLMVSAAAVWVAISLEVARAVCQQNGASAFWRYPRLLTLPVTGIGLALTYFRQQPDPRRPQVTEHLVRHVMAWAGAPEDGAELEA